MTNIISHKHLRSWKPCEDGYKRFCKLFPEGADLETAINGLVKDGREDWGFWLFERCRENNLYPEIISKGYRNSGDWNSGDWNSGYLNSDTPETIRVFNKDCSLHLWESAQKPKFLYFSINDGESYKDAFRRSWENATENDRALVERLPNFDWNIFTEISGIEKPD